MFLGNVFPGGRRSRTESLYLRLQSFPGNGLECYDSLPAMASFGISQICHEGGVVGSLQRSTSVSSCCTMSHHVLFCLRQNRCMPERFLILQDAKVHAGAVVVAASSDRHSENGMQLFCFTPTRISPDHDRQRCGIHNGPVRIAPDWDMTTIPAEKGHFRP